MRIKPEAWLVAVYLAGAALMFQPLLAHDALHTYGYLRSMVFQGNLDLADEFHLHNTHNMYVPDPREAPVNLGLSLVLAPFLVPGALHTAIRALGDSPLPWDGYDPPFVLWYTVGSCALGLAALLLTFRTLKSWAGDGPALAGTLLAFWASPAPAYAFLWPGFHHIPSMILAALVLDLSEKWEGVERRWEKLGFLLGLGLILWPPNLIFGLVVLFRRANFRRPWAGPVLRFSVLFLCGALPQLAVQAAWGPYLIFQPYADRGDSFGFSPSALLQVLVGKDHGLVSSHPGILLLVPAGVWAFRVERRRTLSWLAPAGFLLLLLAAYSGRHGGAAFGARYFIALVPLGAALLAWLFSKARPWVRIASLAWLLAAGVLNMGLLVLFRKEILPHLGPSSFFEMAGSAFSLGWPQIFSFWEADRQNLSLLGGGARILASRAEVGPLLTALGALAFIGACGPALARGLGEWFATGAKSLSRGVLAWSLISVLLIPAAVVGGRLPPAQRLLAGDLNLGASEEKLFIPSGRLGATRLSLVLGEPSPEVLPRAGDLYLVLRGSQGTWSGSAAGRPQRQAQWIPSLAPTHGATTGKAYAIWISVPLDVGRVESLRVINRSRSHPIWIRSLALD